MKATGHLLVAAHSSGRIFIRQKSQFCFSQNQTWWQNQRHVRIRDSFHKVAVMTHGNNNWSQSKLDNLFIILQQKLNMRQGASKSAFSVLFRSRSLWSPHPFLNARYSCQARIVIIPTLNIYFVRTFLGIYAWTSHYHKHNIITEQDFASLNRSKVSSINFWFESFLRSIQSCSFV